MRDPAPPRGAAHRSRGIPQPTRGEDRASSLTAFPAAVGAVAGRADPAGCASEQPARPVPRGSTRRRRQTLSGIGTAGGPVPSGGFSWRVDAPPCKHGGRSGGYCAARRAALGSGDSFLPAAQDPDDYENEQDRGDEAAADVDGRSGEQGGSECGHGSLLEVDRRGSIRRRQRSVLILRTGTLKIASATTKT